MITRSDDSAIKCCRKTLYFGLSYSHQLSCKAIISKYIVSQAIFSTTSCVCVIYKYMILICDLCTMKFLPENGITTDSKKLSEVKKSKEILDLVCLFEAGSICTKYLEMALVLTLTCTLCQGIVH